MKLFEALQNKRKKLDNRGAALVLVILAIGMVLILVTVLMSISYLNYQMKMTEKKSKDNFYSAEVVMDQIHAGLEQVVSESTETAYLKAIQTYKVTSIATEPQRIQNFKLNYLTAVRAAICAADSEVVYYIGEDADYSSATGLYQKGLARFLDQELATIMYETSRGMDPDCRLEIDCALESGNSLIWAEDGLTLKDLRVAYTDEDGYYTQIQTDIHIGYPQVSLSEVAVLPNVFEYAIIAEDTLLFDQTSTTVKSNVYAGGKTDEEGNVNSSIVVSGNSNIQFDNVPYVVAKNDISVKQSKLDFRDGTVWAKEMRVEGAGTRGTSQDSSVLAMSGASYIADDLTTTKYNITVDLDGKYYGYGCENGIINGQSAILLNSSNTSLNMSGLEELLLNGSAYLNGKAITAASVPSKEGNSGNVLLGTSVAMKTDQIAFLAPAECLGTEGSNIIIGKNPMIVSNAADAVGYEQWITVTDKGSNYKKLNVEKQTELLGYPLSHYGIGETDYQTIFRTVGGETVCYVYLNFDSEELAAAYYRDYMQTAYTKMTQYMQKYGNTITFNSGSTAYDLKNNMLTYSLADNTMAIVENTIDSSMSEDAKTELDTRQKDYAQSFDALCSKLTTNYSALSATEKTKSVYENIINTTALNDLNTTESGYSAGGYYAIVADNVGDSAVRVGSASSNDDCKLVIASGDVIIEGNFSGTILAGGKVSVATYSGSVISADKDAVKELIQTDLGDDVTLVEKYFVNGEKYALDSDQENEDEYINLESVIAYVNWSKQ